MEVAAELLCQSKAFVRALLLQSSWLLGSVLFQSPYVVANATRAADTTAVVGLAQPTAARLLPAVQLGLAMHTKEW